MVCDSVVCYQKKKKKKKSHCVELSHGWTWDTCEREEAGLYGLELAREEWGSWKVETGLRQTVILIQLFMKLWPKIVAAFSMAVLNNFLHIKYVAHFQLSVSSEFSRNYCRQLHNLLVCCSYFSCFDPQWHPVLVLQFAYVLAVQSHLLVTAFIRMPVFV